MKKNLLKLSVLFVGLVALLGLIACTTTTTTTTRPTTTTTRTTTATTTQPTTTTTATTTTTSATTTRTTTTGTTTTTGPTTTLPALTINVMQSATLGQYLVDGNGMTLYYFTNDSPGKSTATAAIIANWPVFHASSIIVTAPLVAADFGTITRDDGAPQTTFRDWPLYYFAQDTAPGDTKGQGVNGKWFVVNPADFNPPEPVTVSLVARNFAFDKSSITVPAGAQVTINFDNQDAGTPHNVAVYTSSSATTSIFVGSVISGGQTTYTFTAPTTPGTFFFRCDVHPYMNGSFIVQ
jgi:predicted lipoprotein with Yx(FWY)xxD motif